MTTTIADPLDGITWAECSRVGGEASYLLMEGLDPSTAMSPEHVAIWAAMSSMPASSESNVCALGGIQGQVGAGIQWLYGKQTGNDVQLRNAVNEVRDAIEASGSGGDGSSDWLEIVGVACAMTMAGVWVLVGAELRRSGSVDG